VRAWFAVASKSFTASRPAGISRACRSSGIGATPWSEVASTLEGAELYWLTTVRADGRPHVTPLIGVWHDDALWFSSSLESRKAVNLAHDGRCVLTTDDARNPVIVEGDAERVDDRDVLASFNDAVNEKYDTSYSVDFYDPATNGVWRVRPSWAFGLVGHDFTGSPTRWEFD
jgi:PPOX class probable F420-dependent enzyme